MADHNESHASEECGGTKVCTTCHVLQEDERSDNIDKKRGDGESNSVIQATSTRETLFPDAGKISEIKTITHEVEYKRKKNRKTHKDRREKLKQNLNNDSENEEMINNANVDIARKIKLKKRKKRKSKRGATEYETEVNREHGRQQKRRISKIERSGNFPPNGLWLGDQLLQNECQYTKERSSAQVEPCVSEQKVNHLNLFLARSFCSAQGKENIAVISETNAQANNNRHLDEHYRKKESRHKKVKRIVNLKKTSSKVSINPNELPPVSSRLELDPTARTERQHIPEGINQNVEDGRKESAQFPEPLRLCKFVTRWPLLSFFTITVFHVAIFAITTGLVLSGSDVFPAVFDDLPLYIYNEVRLNELTWRSRTSFPGYIYRPVYGYNINTGYRGRIKDTVEVIYEKPGVNILTPDYLLWIKTAEERLFNEPYFQDYYCLLDHTYTCIKPQSLIRLFDGTYSHVDSDFLDTNFENITNVLYKASIYNETKDYLKLFLGKDSVITPTRSVTTITRSFFFMGWPLYRIQNGQWGREEDLKSYLVNVFKPRIENLRDFYLVERLDVYYLSKMMYEHDLVQQALADIKLAIGSVLFIFLFMCFQTGTIVVTSLGVLSILSSFLLTNLVYRYVFQFKYFGFFHVIAMFLILGIGADDLFVFYDTWRLTGHTKYPSDAHRLSDCFRKAAKTTFVTSLTTTMAFFVSGFSPLLPVKTFGIFTGCLVTINYIWVIVYFPSIIILHHTKTKNLWHKFHRFLLAVCMAETNPNFERHVKSSSSSDTSSISETNSRQELLPDTSKENNRPLTYSSRKDSISKDGAIACISRPNYSSTPRDSSSAIGGHDISKEVTVTLEENVLVANSNVANNPVLDWESIKADTARQEFLTRKLKKPKKNFEDRNRVVKFLRNTFFTFMTKRIVKIVMPLLFLGVSIFFIHRATMIEPDTHQLRLFRSNHNYAKATQRHYFSFLRNQDDEYQRLYLVWGLRPADISACDQKSAEFCFGKPQYDSNFELNSDTAQLAFKDLCNRLENLDPSIADKLHIQRDSITNELKIACFTDDFEQYFKNEIRNNWRLPADMNLSLPVLPEQVDQLMDEYTYIYTNPLPANFNNHFEVLVSYWLTDGYQLNPTRDYFKYNELFAEKNVDGVTENAYYYGSGLYYGTKLQFLAIEINTTMNVYSIGYKEGLPIFREWENFIDSINAEMPEPLKNGIQLTETLWHWLHVQETLASSAVTGIIVGLLTAWPILVLTTLNFIIGTIAAVTIGLVTACVIGLIPLAGWKLGVLESINLCMVVGLSVDYIVHLAEAYRMSKSHRRIDRVHHMLESIGLSVISGAITTMGAAVFMLFAKIQFFFQFGIFILSTVGISLLFSLLGFTTLLSLCGPEGNTGSVTSLVYGIVKFCKKRDRIDDDTSDNPEMSRRFGCPCAPPSVLMDRLYDYLSYDKTERKTANVSKGTKPCIR